ncbi:hypothetical protein ST47_g5226 [Ascochyta rabiei]|uniref:Uncharacterized protein n=1 Tax=Didymella rabiei TaxID=5454 RepID=A0A163EC54_DIDRA|nr:hypothetical protein ST47_g5226 [Ascochyta rabiei]
MGLRGARAHSTPAQPDPSWRVHIPNAQSASQSISAGWAASSLWNVDLRKSVKTIEEPSATSVPLLSALSHAETAQHHDALSRRPTERIDLAVLWATTVRMQPGLVAKAPPVCR